MAKLRSLEEAEAQELRRLQGIRNSEVSRHRTEVAKQKVDEELRLRGKHYEVEASKVEQREREDKRSHEFALAEQRQRASLTEKIIILIVPKAGIFSLAAGGLIIVYSNFVAAILAAVVSAMAAVVWVHKDRIKAVEHRINAMERLQNSNNGLLMEAYQRQRVGLPVIEKAFLTQGGRDGAGLRQIEAASGLASTWET